MGLEKTPKARTKAPKKLSKLTNEEKRKTAQKVLKELPGGKKIGKKELKLLALTPGYEKKQEKLIAKLVTELTELISGRRPTPSDKAADDLDEVLARLKKVLGKKKPVEVAERPKKRGSAS